MAELRRILHVDDDGDIRAIAQLSLETLGGFELHQCASGRQAVAEVEGAAPELFLLDYMMPGMDGEQTLAALRAVPGFEATPVIFMTARVLDDIAATLVAKGAVGVVTKPFDPMELADRIRALWDAGPGRRAAA